MTSVSLLPVIVVLMMIIVGTEITRSQLTTALQMGRALAGATLGQLLLLPSLAVLVVWLLQPSPAVAGGLLLVAVSPGGGMSNYYCALGRLNVAFSVTLTTFSGFVALAAMPLLFATIVPAALGVEAFGVPVSEMMSRLLVFMALPIVVGMTLRQFIPAAFERSGKMIRVSGLCLLIAFLALVFVEERHAVSEMFGEVVAVTAVFTFLGLLAGWASGSVLRLNRADRAVVAVEFAARNVGIASLLALISFQKPEFAAFGALFLLLQGPILLVAVLLGARLPSLVAGENNSVARADPR